jgi:hypothetical protein
VLAEKMLPEKKTAEPVAGLLYFPKLTITPQKAAATTSHPGEICGRTSAGNAELFPHIAV